MTGQGGRGVSLLTFSTPREFIESSKSLERDAHIYVDAHLGHGESGVSVSKTISDLGFTEVYLATGDPPTKFKPMPRLRGILGKEVPWENLERT